MMIELCPICSAKDKEMYHMTAHIARLTQMMAQDHDTIQSLKYELLLEKNKHDRLSDT
jgi:tmRNA-binding protein